MIVAGAFLPWKSLGMISRSGVDGGGGGGAGVGQEREAEVVAVAVGEQLGELLVRIGGGEGGVDGDDGAGRHGERERGGQLGDDDLGDQRPGALGGAAQLDQPATAAVVEDHDGPRAAAGDRALDMDRAMTWQHAATVASARAQW